MVLEWSETPRDCASGILNNYLSHFGSPLHSKSNLRASGGLLGHYLYQDDALASQCPLDLLILKCEVPEFQFIGNATQRI